MKTIVIWDQCGQEEISFYVLDGDFTRFNGVYANMCCPSGRDEAEWDKLQDELGKMTYDGAGNRLFEASTEFPYDAVKEGAKVIVAGFLP